MDASADKQTPLGDTSTPPDLIVIKGLNKDYGMKSTFATVGVVSIVIGFIALFIVPTASFLLGFGILYVMMGFGTPLKFRESSCIFKPAALVAGKEIKYNEITKIESQPKRITVYYRKTQAKIDKATFNADDWEEINIIFKEIKRKKNL